MFFLFHVIEQFLGSFTADEIVVLVAGHAVIGIRGAMNLGIETYLMNINDIGITNILRYSILYNYII